MNQIMFSHTINHAENYIDSNSTACPIRPSTSRSTQGTKPVHNPRTMKRLERVESILRLLCLALTGVAACIFGFNKQRKQIFSSLYKDATVRDMHSLWVLMIVAAVSSGYESLQLLKSFLVVKFQKRDHGAVGKWESWTCFILDQGIMYSMMATTAATLQSSAIAMGGINKLQWMKLCDMYGAFCRLNGVALALVVCATVMMILLSTISAHQLFSLYLKTLKQPPLPSSKHASERFHSSPDSTTAYSVHSNPLYHTDE